jgi:hypothetical protein
MIKDLDPERWPPRNTRVNMSIQIHVQETTQARMARPRASSSGFAARMRHANSSTPIALPIARRPRRTLYIHRLAITKGTKEPQRMTLSWELVPFHAPLKLEMKGYKEKEYRMMGTATTTM